MPLVIAERHPYPQGINPVAEPDIARRMAFQIPGVVNPREPVGPRGRDFSIDPDPLLNDPAECERVASWYVEILRKIRTADIWERLDCLAFIEKAGDRSVGALRLAGHISIRSLTPHIVVRLDERISGDKIKLKTSHVPELPQNVRLAGYKLALLTDQCITGTETLAATAAVEENGGQITHLLAYSIIASEFNWEAFSEKNIAVHQFLTAPDDLIASGLFEDVPSR